MDKNKNIKCNVESCKYNISDDKYCSLKQIKISSTENPCDSCKEETICDSFKEK